MEKNIQKDLKQLRVDSFVIIIAATTLAIWVWFSWAMMPTGDGATIRSDTWPASVFMLLVLLACYLIKPKFPYTAILIFTLGLLITITGVVLQLHNLSFGYTLCIPIIFSGILFSRIGLISVATMTSLIILGVAHFTNEFHDADLAHLAIILGLVTSAMWASTYHLQTTLFWSLNGYQEAHKNELIVREQKARLERTLQSLDATMYQLQRTNAMLVEARNQAEEARRLKQQFAQTISHELRTPLNLIVGFTETMVKSPEYYGAPLAPTYARDLSAVYRNACHLQNLVNDVLDLARLEQAYLLLIPEKINIAHVIEDAVNTARGLIERRDLALRLDIAPDLPMISGDAVRIKQVLLNLLNNAARFTEEGSITVSAYAQEHQVIVGVADTGIGIAPEKFADIFEPFQQLENPMQRQRNGAGLGLAISKQLVELHGGSIWLESELSKGSQFFFSLPAYAIPTDHRIEAVLMHQLNTAKSTPLVLVVTRSPSAASLISRNLAQYRTVVIGDFKQALAASLRLIPEYIILDTATDDFSETEAEKFTEALQLPNVKILACPLPGEEMLRRSLSVDGYIIKPVNQERLWDLISQFEGKRILLVDDDRDFVRLMSRLLSSSPRPVQVASAYSGSEALAMIKQYRPEIILLDLNLSDIDGLQLIKQMRALSEAQNMRIIVVTAYEIIDASKHLQGKMSIRKTFGLTPTEVIQWIEIYLRGLTKIAS
ncbi:MAG: response regulator [Chloroflexi bacterium]|nr:response regulator [Chloroflexota bacterium]